MPPELIRVQPATALRRDFAVWAVAQRPKVRTVSQSVFAVPADQFVKMPERLLIGSVVDGHRYISPDEDQAQPAADTAAAELLGVGLPEVEGIPGEPLPEVPAEAYGPDSTPLPPPEFAPLEDAPAEDDDSDGSDSGDETGDGFTCDVCSRPFKSERGRDTHRRQAHPEA
ncbi:hypothetical protein [Streptomyces carpinensis]|uniref:C2H2-type domain-containing protein n=1 Tax=Streptomyces carpinensis TaxID=66369 RepID=A0ABV1VUT9_9ACTN|nr:hypothetical protein [Streptomyces carpinensis]